MAYPRNGPASRAVALDLMLRTFMNSADFHPSNPKIWENIAKLVPGTTPQQCAQRWEELRTSSLSIAGDYSGLTATGRPISGQGRRQMTRYVRSMFSQQLGTNPSPSHNLRGSYNSGSHGNVLRSQSGYHYTRQSSGSTSSNSMSNIERRGSNIAIEAVLPHHVNEPSGKFVANFCQTHLNGGEKKEGKGSEESKEENGKSTTVEDTSSSDGSLARINGDTGSKSELNGSTHKHGPSMVIHVCDEAKKLKRDFICPRDILVREMHYFEEYLSSSETQLWDEVDISVHCDVPVFEWLMKYAKRGMLEGPCGEKLSSPLEPPKLEPNTAVSILISSDFLKMDTLVEECLIFCHDRISQIVASPCNMGCINNRLLARLAEKFTPLELEGITDRKDKIKSKLFLYQLEQLFRPNHSSPECPANAASLYRCQYCGKLLTSEQQSVLPCAAKRLSVDCHGRAIFNHERSDSWNINTYLQSLQKQEGLSPRDLYWRVWGVVNWLRCKVCRCMFQCSELPLCAYHPQPIMVMPSYSGERPSVPLHSCCRRPVLGFSTLPQVQDGCTFRDHVVSASSTHNSTAAMESEVTDSDSKVYSIVCQLRGTICTEALRAKANKDDSELSVEKKESVEGSPLLQQARNEVCFLQNEQREPRLPPTSAGEVPISHNSRDVSRGRSSESLQNSLSSQVLNALPQPAPARHQHRGGGVLLARQTSRDSQQQSRDLMELEEDEDDECEHPPVLVHYPRPRRGRHQHHGHGHQIRSKTSRQDLRVEWIWDSQKSKRWNQDMQRESDERRLAHLVSKLNSTEVIGSASSRPNQGGSGGTNKTSAIRGLEGGVYAGGIFSRLEAQFRAQQAAKALALQNNQTRSQGSSRKR